MNQGLVYKPKQNIQVNKIVKKTSVQLSSSNDNKLREQDPEDMKIRIPRTTRDDKRFLSMSASHDGGPIP